MSIHKIKTCCGEAILMSTHNIRFYGELTKIILPLSSNLLLICSSGGLSDFFFIVFHEIQRQALNRVYVITV